MKNCIIFLLICCGIHTSFAQSKEEMVRLVRKEFQAINNDSTLKTVVLNNEDFLDEMPDGGGSLTGFYKDGKIRKIVEWIGISHGINIREFYFKDNQLIFVYTQFKSFVYDEKKDTLDLMHTTLTSEGRYYFKDGKLISSIGAKEDSLKKEAADLHKMLQQKK